MLDSLVDRQRLIGLRDLARLGGGALAPAVAVSFLAGVLPVAFVMATSVMIGALPAAARDGAGSAAAHRAEFALLAAAAVFALRQALIPLQAVTVLRVARRYDGRARARFMAAAFSPRSTGPLERHEAREAISVAGQALQGWGVSPGDAAAANIAVLARYSAAVAMAVPVGLLYSWWVAAWVLASGIVLRLVFRRGFGHVVGRERKGWSHLRQSWYFRHLGLTAEAGKELRVFGLLPWFAARYRAATDEFMRVQWSVRWRSFVLPWLVGSVVAAGILAVAYADVAVAASRGEVTLERLSFVLQAGFAILSVASWYPEADMATAYGGQNYGQLLELEQIVAHAPRLSAGTGDPRDLPRREIRLEGVSFAYPTGAAPVLADLDLTVTTGRSLAIVGLNGAGKTTLVKVLAGLYDPDRGTIWCDDVDIRSFERSAWQRRFAPVFQDFQRYELSLRENVGFGALPLVEDDAAIELALARAGAAGLSETLAAGLATPLSPAYAGGTDLSDGQWQRVAIARALLAVHGGATVLLLDEPTANLDVRAEAEFFEHFLEATRGITSLLISHRFSSVRHADQIVVLEEGRIVESGTHLSLLSDGGRYAEMFQMQAGRFQQTDDGA